MYEKLTRLIRAIIPKTIFRALAPAYHFLLTMISAFYYRFPSRKIFLVGVTGTKGKTSTTEMINAILENAGHTTAIASTLRIKVGDNSKRNLFKMTMPGRMFLQGFLRKAVNAGCEYAIIEMTSEGAKQFRHRFLEMDTLVFTNLSPEHIESHGSYKKYRAAKLSIAQALAHSQKPHTWMIANADDKEAEKFFDVAKGSEQIGYSLKDAGKYTLTPTRTTFVLDGLTITAKLPGQFNLSNMLAAIAFAKTQNISADTIKAALEGMDMIRGRLEEVNDGQDFRVIVDYAHTPDSLEKAYAALGNTKKICVLGGTGGGRDTWKRKVMGEIADRECAHIILTDEDPYDEDPECIVNMIAEGITKTPCDVIMDRRKAIVRAFSLADNESTVIITGKGTDPYIMGPNGTKTPWDDATVAREELKRRPGTSSQKTHRLRSKNTQKKPKRKTTQK